MIKVRLCGTCHFWLPLRSNPTIGLCSANMSITGYHDENPQCHILLKLSKLEYVWCKDCDAVIARDEVEDHIFHELHPLPYIDEGAHEETYDVS